MAITLLTDSLHQAGVIGDKGFGAAPLGQQLVVTAVTTGSGRLRLISWRVSSDGRTIDRLLDSGDQGDLGDRASICGAAFGFVVTAHRLDTGKLRITAWQVNLQTGAIKRAGDDDDSEAAVVEVTMADAPTADGRVVVAVTDAAGNVVLKNWEVDKFGKLHRRGDTAKQGGGAGKSSQLDLRWAGGRLVGAMRTAGGNLKVIVWALLADGTFKRLGSGEAGAVGRVSLAAVLDGRVVTAVRDGSNNLKLIAWKISADGLTVTRGPDAAAGGVGALSIVFHDLSGPTPQFPLDEGELLLLTAVQTKRRLVKLTKWRLGQKAITRLDDFGENTGTVDAVGRIVKLIDGVRLLVARDGNGRLRLTTYDLDGAAQPTALADALTLFGTVTVDDKKFVPVENTVSVVPPVLPATVKGQVVVHLGQPRQAAGFAHRPLLDGGSTFAISPPATFVPYPLGALQANATDNQIVRLTNGDLLASKNGYVWNDLDPAPEWFGTATVLVEGTGAGDVTDPQARNAVLLFRSTNAGATWGPPTVLDSAVVAGGAYGWPQPKKAGKTGFPSEETGIWGVGGFDRTELYQDPWTGTIYVSGHGDGGPFTKADGTVVENHGGVIFKSADAKAWTLLQKLDAGVHAPYVMTSTPNFPLVVLTHKGGGDALLYTLEKGATKLTGPHVVSGVVDGLAVAVGADIETTKDVQKNTPGTTSIARVGVTDAVRIAYPALNADGRQVYVVCGLALQPDGSIVVVHTATIEALDPVNWSCALGAFAVDDRIDAKNDATMFSWIEVPAASAPDTTKILARYRVFFGTAGQYRAGVLSPAPFKRRSHGDYRKTPAFRVNGKTHYLSYWLDGTGIRANVVSLAP